MAERNIIVDGGKNNARTKASGDLFAGVAQTLFSTVSNATTSGVSAEEVYTNAIPAGTMSANGNRLTAIYNGVFAANARLKSVRLKFAGTSIFNTNDFDDVGDNGTAWKLWAEIIRTSNTVVECNVTLLRHSFLPWMKVTDISSLNLTTTEYNLILELQTEDAAGDVTANGGWARYNPGV